MNSSITHKNQLGSGIYTISDISRILGFKRNKVARYLDTYWDKRIGREMFSETYSWSAANNVKAVNFYVLIELYTFITLQDMGISTQKVFKARQQIAKDLRVQYPFASAGILTDGKKIWYEFSENIVDADGTRQMNLVQIIREFAQRIDFNSKNKLAERYYPAGKEKSIVVDPHHQFGLPVIKGTNVNAEVLYSMFDSGESMKNIGILYDLSPKQVKEAIEFFKRKAA